MNEDALKKGSAETLILALLEEEPLHGYGLAQRIQERSDGVLQFHVTSLYPTLYRLEERGLVEGSWEDRDGERRRRYYRLTPDGRDALAGQRSSWRDFIDAMSRVAGLENA